MIWHWPQYFIAALLALRCISKAATEARTAENGSLAVFGVAVMAALFVFEAWVLHDGGFW